jgi:prepilin-type N-terminal cleavage/methylation domain-containing protein/prepilin-type processing-associated H-X9-DG protein
MARSLKNAFTLVELLVVIAIIGILVVLLLPAIQAAREAARRSQCKNNLKQIGLGLHNFESSRHAFPPGFVSTPKGNVVNAEGTDRGWGWGAYILPYLEESSLFQQIDFKTNIEANTSPNKELRVATLQVFRCPSDSVELPIFNVTDATGNPITQLAFGNYVGVAGTYEVSVCPDGVYSDLASAGKAECVYADRANGVFYRNHQISIKQIADGTSHTIMVAERASRQSPQTTWAGAVTNAVIPPKVATYDNEGPPVLVLTNTGQARDNTGKSIPNPRVPNNDLGHVEDSNSMHPQGVNIMFCDASVQTINNDIDPDVWVALGTRAGSEPAGSY